MAPLESLAWLSEPRPEPTEDQIVDAWIAFGGAWTLDEFRPAYLASHR